MTDLKSIQSAIEQIAPPHLAEEWDNSGFQICCDQAKTVRRIEVEYSEVPQRESKTGGRI